MKTILALIAAALLSTNVSARTNETCLNMVYITNGGPVVLTSQRQCFGVKHSLAAVHKILTDAGMIAIGLSGAVHVYHDPALILQVVVDSNGKVSEIIGSNNKAL